MRGLFTCPDSVLDGLAPVRNSFVVRVHSRVDRSAPPVDQVDRRTHRGDEDEEDVMFKRIVLMGIGAACALSVGAAGAYFTSQLKVADSVIAAGTVAISTTPTSAPLSINGLAPGKTVTKPLTIVNDGSLASDVMITSSRQAGITDFYNALDCRVIQGGNLLYRGPLSALRTTSMRVSAGARADLTVDVSLPASATNEFQGDYAKFALNIDAEQVH